MDTDKSIQIFGPDMNWDYMNLMQDLQDEKFRAWGVKDLVQKRLEVANSPDEEARRFWLNNRVEYPHNGEESGFYFSTADAAGNAGLEHFFVKSASALEKITADSPLFEVQRPDVRATLLELSDEAHEAILKNPDTKKMGIDYKEWNRYFNTGLKNPQDILSHPVWQYLLDGDRHLLKAYIELCQKERNTGLGEQGVMGVRLYGWPAKPTLYGGGSYSKNALMGPLSLGPITEFIPLINGFGLRSPRICLIGERRE